MESLSMGMYFIVMSFVALLSGVAGFLLRKRLYDVRIGSAKEVAQDLIEGAEKKAEMIKKEAALQAKDKFYQEKAEFEKETFEKSVRYDCFKFSGGFIDCLSGRSSDTRGRGPADPGRHRGKRGADCPYWLRRWNAHCGAVR